MTVIDLNKPREPNRFKRFKNRFYKWGIDLCDGKWPYYGGHTHWLSNLLNVDYLHIGLCIKLGYEHVYYDGQHHSLYFGLFYLSWGGAPFHDL